MATAADGRDWWTTILAGGGLTAAEHIRLAEELMAFSHRTALANPGKLYACVTEDTERAKVHAEIAQAIALHSLASRTDLP